MRSCAVCKKGTSDKKLKKVGGSLTCRGCRKQQAGKKSENAC